MDLDDQARRMLQQERDLEEVRAELRKHLSLVIALACHPMDLPINNPQLISVARACATLVAVPMIPPEEKK